MRMSRYDRRMAIKRHPAFIKEYGEYVKLRQLDQSKSNEEITQEIFKRYVGFYLKWGEEIDLIEQAEKMPDKKRSGCIKEVATIENVPIKTFTLRRGGKTNESYITGKKLYLEVDIFENNTTLENEFKRIISKYREILPEDKTKNRELALDHWEIYDLKKKNNNLSFYKMAQVLSGIKGNPNDNPKIKSWEKTATTAFNRACKMIEQVGEEAKKKT